MITMRDGTEVDDPRLGRLVEFDDRSRDYPVRAAAEPPVLRSYTWSMPLGWVIDQGREGACVGFAIINELQARPAPVRLTSIVAAQVAATGIYHRAQREDPWPGGAYPGASPRYDGTSVLAGMKVAQRAGAFGQYRWAFGVEDVLHGIGRHGPAILGINWHADMYSPDARGYVRPTGRVVGGHAILARAVRIVRTPDRHVDRDRSFVTLRNSWGPGWGIGGDGYITVTDLAALLSARGEAVFAVDRVTSWTPDRIT